MQFKELEHNVVKYAYEKGLVTSEGGEMLEKLLQSLVPREVRVKLDPPYKLGYMLINLIIQAEIQQVNLLDCLEDVLENFRSKK